MKSGDYEVALFGWASSGQIVTGQNIYTTKRPQNYGQYSNPTVDKAWEEVAATLDEKVQLEQLKIIEMELWNDLATIPLYTHPGLTAYDSTIGNVRSTMTQNNVVWNGEQWLVAN